MTNMDRQTALPPTPDKSQKQTKLKWPPQNISVGDDITSHSSEALSIGLSELQKLPRKAKIPIRDFVQEKISSLDSKDEDVPVKLKVLAEAVHQVDNKQDEAADDSEIGLTGSILHTAAAIGLLWILEMQIKAGVDLAALDDHSWTALMIATAQGHKICAQLLSEHMLTIGANSLSETHPPSGLGKTLSSTFIDIGSDNLSAMPNTWHPSLSRGVQVRSNHPIPPKYASFYYEMTILRNGPLKYVCSLSRNEP